MCWPSTRGRTRRDIETTHCRDAHANPDEMRTCSPVNERNGTAKLFMLFAPLEGWRHVEVTDRHTAVDYAHVLKDLADRRFPHAKTIVLVQDNLNIHSGPHPVLTGQVA